MRSTYCMCVLQERDRETPLIGERDTIRGVQIRAGAVCVYTYIYMYICMEVRVP